MYLCARLCNDFYLYSRSVAFSVLHLTAWRPASICVCQFLWQLPNPLNSCSRQKIVQTITLENFRNLQRERIFYFINQTLPVQENFVSHETYLCKVVFPLSFSIERQIMHTLLAGFCLPCIKTKMMCEPLVTTSLCRALTDIYSPTVTRIKYAIHGFLSTYVLHI
jgi:hypothetical protein